MLVYPVTYRQILEDPDFPGLMEEYAAECSIPELGECEPREDLYSLMEASGGLQCFGLYARQRLVGFACLLIYHLPHYGAKVATTESIFISAKNRAGRAGLKLLEYLEAYATGRGCSAVLYTAPTGSRFSALLAAREYRRTSNVFVRAL